MNDISQQKKGKENLEPYPQKQEAIQIKAKKENFELEEKRDRKNKTNQKQTFRNRSLQARQKRPPFPSKFKNQKEKLTPR